MLVTRIDEAPPARQRHPSRKRSFQCRPLATAAVLGCMLGLAAATLHAQATTDTTSTPQTTAWTAEQTATLQRNDTNTVPDVVAPRTQLMPGYWMWDSWPLRNKDGSIARLNGWIVWMSLTAENSVLPGKRHDIARIRYLISRDGVNWKPMGLVFPTAGALGSRNWASDAIFLPETQEIVMLYTATGDASENCRANGLDSQCDKPITYVQHIAWAKGSVKADDNGVTFSGWQHKLLLDPDGQIYQSPEQTGGQLYAFRDPHFYVDPKDGREYLIFEGNTASPGRTGGVPSPGGGGGPSGSGSGSGGGSGSAGGSGSGGGSATGGGSGSGIGSGSGSPGGTLSGAPIGTVEFNGAVGIAEAVGDNRNLDQWKLLPPLLTANAVNQELERPHVVNKDGRYFLFIDSHIGKFAPGVTAGPEGMYGWSSNALFGPWTPLNGSGLVLGNPDNDANRFQSYSWLVLPDFSVTSFLDTFNLPAGVNLGNLPEQSPEFQKEQFGGTYMPLLHLAINGDTSEIVVTDVNRDGITTYDDVRFASQFVGTQQGDLNYSRWMDMNRDGRIDAFDLAFIERYAQPSTTGEIVQGLEVPESRPVQQGISRTKGAAPGFNPGSAQSGKRHSTWQ